MAGKLVNNPVMRMAVESGVDGAINGVGSYMTGPGPHIFRPGALSSELAGTFSG